MRPGSTPKRTRGGLAKHSSFGHVARPTLHPDDHRIGMQCQRKEVSSSVKEVSTSGNNSESGSFNPQHWRRLWEIALARMSTPTRSRSSVMGDEGYFDWRVTME
ncbi:hypothetical protein CK203_029716 [Vitis vinifera]|uniref:Uncharacterized protein n=1 Tax=Vitis vinifera TaxID=29760 RepID=A0A438II87_VITVI|nr:hypothetical protein CK203_029716 [Vitis vinifera]